MLLLWIYFGKILDDVSTDPFISCVELARTLHAGKMLALVKLDCSLWLVAMRVGVKSLEPAQKHVTIQALSRTCSNVFQHSYITEPQEKSSMPPPPVPTKTKTKTGKRETLQNPEADF